jgi:DNA polymerase-3 subunit beta
MKITVKQNELSKALNLVSRIAGGSRATLPILNNVLIKAEDKKVTLTTTNLDMAVVDYLPVSDSEEGTITVPAKLMAEFISNLPSGESITLSTEGEKVICKAGKYTSRVNGAEAEDFPELPEIDEEKAVIFTISADEFKKGMSQVTVAASNDTTRPALRGVYFNTYKGALYLAATDGYRMAELKFIEKVESEVKAIVPVESLQEVLRSISEEQEEVVMLFDETQVRFRLREKETCVRRKERLLNITAVFFSL